MGAFDGEVEMFSYDEKRVLSEALEFYATDLGQRIGSISTEYDRYERHETLQRILADCVVIGDILTKIHAQPAEAPHAS